MTSDSRHLSKKTMLSDEQMVSEAQTKSAGAVKHSSAVSSSWQTPVAADCPEPSGEQKASSDDGLHPLLKQVQQIQSHELMELVETSLKRAGEAMTVPTDGSNQKMSQSLAEDIIQFVQEARAGGKDWANRCNPALDSLMLQAVQVLNSHTSDMDELRTICENFRRQKTSEVKEKFSALLQEMGVPGQMTTDMSSADPSQKPTADDDAAEPARDGAKRTASESDTADLSDNTATQGEEDKRSRTRRRGTPKNKRSMFPKEVTKVLKEWLMQNFENPYPTEEQKKSMSTQTGLTILQVNNWFINARRRLVQPLIDQYNKDNPSAANSSTQNTQQPEATKSRKRASSSSAAPNVQYPAPKRRDPSPAVAMVSQHAQPQTPTTSTVTSTILHVPIAAPAGTFSLASNPGVGPMATMASVPGGVSQIISMSQLFTAQPQIGMQQPGFWPTDAQTYMSAHPQALSYMSGPTTVDPTGASMIPRYTSWPLDTFYHDLEHH